jgi:hypothetical protein
MESVSTINDHNIIMRDEKIINQDIETEDVSVEIETPFNPKDVDITMKTLTVDLLVRRLERNEIDLFTEFQREQNLWKPQQQSRLIESMLIRFPLPLFYFDAADENKWLVVDGLQRLSSINNFIVNRTLMLNGLEFLGEFDGATYDTLPRELQRRLEETQIIAYIINPGTPLAVRYNLFSRINTGGLLLEPQEIRHALNQGVPADFVRELAQSQEFIQATDGRVSSRRMLDRDFVMRALAFMMTPYSDYKPPLDLFLGKEMARLKIVDVAYRKMLKERFLNALQTARAIFEQDAFRKRLNPDDSRFPINKSLFEVWVSHLSDLSPEQRSTLIEKKEPIKQKFMQLNTQKDFTNAITRATADSSSVQMRHQAIAQLIQEVLT